MTSSVPLTPVRAMSLWPCSRSRRRANACTAGPPAAICWSTWPCSTPIEASQPAISTTKLAGLTTHYGLREDSPGNGYFELHAMLDVEHARHARELIAELARRDTEADSERMLTRAEAALGATGGCSTASSSSGPSRHSWGLRLPGLG